MEYYCANCLRNHHAISAFKLTIFPRGRNVHIARGSRAFKSVKYGRLFHAEIARVGHSLDQLADCHAKVRRNCESKRDRLCALRKTLAQRRRTLNAACLLPTQSQMLTKESQELSVLSQTIARACSGLVQELVEVFHIVEVGGRPGARDEWTVGGLVLPVPGDVRWRIIGYPPDHINAASNSLLRFRGLAEDSVSVCLGSEQDEGVNPGAKRTAKHPLHLTSNPSSTSSSPSLSSRTPPASLADSEAPEQAPAHGRNQSFTTGLPIQYVLPSTGLQASGASAFL
ncbi:hypothetical protein EV702DRAFT_1204907 [Suillus placidus]|uniref:Autophagy-related protein 14 n=1 Tax=Suillus placidus TaxID=48579 RepID=A0A9P7CW48_9AGAM|nr:hypothetical protein EV702DRAFT_1204907 [Suillus placidus]